MSNSKKFREDQKIKPPTLKDIYIYGYNRDLPKFIEYLLSDPFAVLVPSLRNGFEIRDDGKKCEERDD